MTGATPITEAVVEALHEVLSVPDVLDAFKRSFERRVGERAMADPPVDLEQQLQAARTRVGNATRLIVEMPDDLDLRRQREADRAEVKRLEGELELRAVGPSILPDRKKVAAAIAQFLKAIAMDAPDRRTRRWPNACPR